jgi:hypothetical protein
MSSNYGVFIIASIYRRQSLLSLRVRTVCIERGSAHCLAFASCPIPLQASSEPLCFHITALKFIAFLVFWSNCQVGTCISPCTAYSMYSTTRNRKKRQTMAASEAFSEHDLHWICFNNLDEFLSGPFWMNTAGGISRLDTNGKSHLCTAFGYASVRYRLWRIFVYHLGQDWIIRALSPDTFSSSFSF